MNERKTAIMNDNRLMEMALYWETKGGVLTVKNPEDIGIRFTEFKGLVQRGSFTIDQLETKVFKTFGIMNSGKEELEPNDFYKELEELTEELASKMRDRGKNPNEKKQ